MKFFWRAFQRSWICQSAWSLLFHCVISKDELPFEGGETSSHDGDLRNDTNERIVEVFARDLVCGSQVKAQKRNWQHPCLLNPWWHGVEGGTIRVAVPGHVGVGELGGLYAYDFQQAPRRRELVCA